MVNKFFAKEPFNAPAFKVHMRNHQSSEISLTKIQHYVFSKHHVIPGKQKESVKEIARSLVGLHSARLPSPYVILHCRLEQFKSEDLRNSLHHLKDVIKLRCMRKTLHILPLEFAPIAHKATINLRTADCISHLRKLNFKGSFHQEIKEGLLTKLASCPLSGNELSLLICDKLDSIGQMKKTSNKKLSKILLKLYWEEGTICYLNYSQRWDSEKRLYGSTRHFYPRLDLDSISVLDAQASLVSEHVQRYGPVTLKDISWWSGLSLRLVRETVERMIDLGKAVQMTIDGFGSAFFMCPDDYKALINFKIPRKSWICFLAYEDSSLKGYFESRFRYVDEGNYDALFNQIGEVRPSIVMDGKVIGVWNWNKKSRKISMNLFIHVTRKISSMLEEKKLNLEKTLLRDYLKSDDPVDQLSFEY